jgi:phage terminase large subunit-like protein
LNQWVNSVTRWLQIDKWDACKVDEMPELSGPCYAGLDLASTTDLTAFARVWPLAEGYAVKCSFWIPEDAMREREHKDRVPYSQWVRQGLIRVTPGAVLDYDYVLHDIQELLKTEDIQELAFDRWGSQKLVADLSDIGFELDPKAQGRHLIQFGQGYASMSPPTKELMTQVLQKRIIHDGNPVLRWCIDNLVVTQDPAGNIKPDKAKATQRIDGAVASIMALDRAVRHQEAGPSIYETQEVKSF